MAERTVKRRLQDLGDVSLASDNVDQSRGRVRAFAAWRDRQDQECVSGPRRNTRSTRFDPGRLHARICRWQVTPMPRFAPFRLSSLLIAFASVDKPMKKRKQARSWPTEPS
jgi:hypothetical protein